MSDLNSFIIIDHQDDNPFFNLAAEEYLLHNFKENVVFLYVNNPSVVIGKHQNAFDECQIDFCESNDIQIIRRLSGGGTVFHGPGNLNFCFIKNGEDSTKLIDFKKHLTPVNEFLHGLGIPSEYSGRNDLLVDGFKISGNAEHVYNKAKRVIHHGTLLYDADLSSLKQSIAPKAHLHFETHAVKSVRSTVRNIKTFLEAPLSFERFNQDMFSFMSSYYNAAPYRFTPEDLKEIDALIEAKYSQWDWNFGYSPKFEVAVQLGDDIQIQCKVVKGMITKVESNSGLLTQLQDCVGLPFTKKTFKTIGLDVSL